MANGYYTHTTFPAINSYGASSAMRAELDAITAGFALLPNPIGIGQQGFSGGNFENPIIVGGTLDNVIIGGTTPAAATFTTLEANAAVEFNAGGTLAGTFTGGAFTGATIDNTVIGGTTRAAGSFTTLGANAAVTFSGGGAFTGTFVGGAWNSSTIDNAIIGGITPAPATFTNLSTTGTVTFSQRPTWAGHTPWDNSNLTNLNQLTNGPGYQTASGTVAQAGVAAALGKSNGFTGPMYFNWSGQGGQPSWLWGSNDGTNFYVWNPSNFSVNYANSAGSAGSVGGVSGPATRGAIAGTVNGNNFGVVSSQGGGLPSNYVVYGLTGPGNGTANAISVLGAQLYEN